MFLTPQTINFPVASTGGNWGLGGCGSASERGTTTNGAIITASWTDTTGDSVGTIAISLHWKFCCTPTSYTVTINGANLGGGTLAATNCVCNASSYQTTTQTFSSGFSIVANGTNTVTITETTGGYSWIGFMDSSGWAISITDTPG